MFRENHFCCTRCIWRLISVDKPRKKIHLFNEWPHIYELEDMMAFCSKYEHLYIYGCAYNQQYLLKYLDMCGVKVEGYIVTELQENYGLFYREIPVRLADEVINEDGTGIIVGLSDRHYAKVIPLLRKTGRDNYFVMSEYNKRAIACQMTPRKKTEMTFEVNIADHCNLSCQMCDHYSQLSDKWFVDVDDFAKDMHEMGRIFDHELGAITLLGGEPTLHPNIVKLLDIARDEFPTTELIVLTNGVLLLKMDEEFWRICRDKDVHITVTVYPIKIDYEAIEAKAKEYGVALAMSSNIHANKLTRIPKISDKHTMDLEGNVPKFYCVNCLYFNKFNVVKNGKYYMCPVAAHIDIFNNKFNKNLELKNDDYLDIYKVKDWHEFAEFASSYKPFCSYCDLKSWGPHSVWKASSLSLDEYV